MYEMTEVIGEDGVRQQNRTPSAWLMAADFPRWASEVGMHRAVSSMLPKRNPGQGRPVLVVPGIGANDGMTKRLVHECASVTAIFAQLATTPSILLYKCIVLR
jgi:hypothetical protein